MILEPDLHKDVEAHLSAVNALVDRLGRFVETNNATIRHARELTERIKVLRNQIAERKRGVYFEKPL